MSVCLSTCLFDIFFPPRNQYLSHLRLAKTSWDIFHGPTGAGLCPPLQLHLTSLLPLLITFQPY